MLIDVQCPGCQDVFPITEAAGKQKIDCPSCGERFAVGSNSGPEALSIPSRPGPKVAAGSVRRRRDDDDEGDRPSRRSRGQETRGAALGVILIGGAGLLVLAIGFAVTLYLIFSKDDPEEDPAPALVADENKRPGIPFPRGGMNRPGPNFPGRVAVPVGPARPPIESKPVPQHPVAPPAKIIPLPAPAGQVCVGASGKYLFLHLKPVRQVAVFNPAAGKVERYLPVEEEEVLLAAGFGHLVVGYPEKNSITRYTLSDFEKDATVPVPSKHPLRGLALGAGSNGPLLVACGNFPHGDEFFLMDVLTMKRVAGTEIKNPGVHPDAAMRMWASRDGRTFSATSGGLSRSHVYRIQAGRWEVNASPCNPPMLASDGSTVYGNGIIATPSGLPLGEKRGGHGKAVWYAPAVDGPFFLSFSERVEGKWPKELKYLEVAVHAGRDATPLHVLSELPETEKLVDFHWGKTKPLDQHAFYFASAKSLVLLPADRDSLHLRDLDLKAELARGLSDHIVVASQPPPAVEGRTFRYEPEVWTRSGRAVVTVESGPPGMKMEGGAVVWDVPPDFRASSVSVILKVSAGGKVSFQNFELPVIGR